MATIVLEVPDESLVPKVKHVCKMLKGVSSVKVQKPAKPKKYDIFKAMDDVKHGRVTDYDTIEALYKEHGII